jgi:predicted nuclease with TOPRIM domain
VSSDTTSKSLIEEGDESIREQAQTRLEMLRNELEKGQAELQKVEMQRTYLRESVLRISGAVQVLEELLAEGQPVGQPNGTDPGEVSLASGSNRGKEEPS